jgi:hypothetical protein
VLRRVRALQAREFRVNRGAGRGGTLENARFLFGANVACNFIALVVRGAYWTLQRPGQKSVNFFGKATGTLSSRLAVLIV